MRDLIKALVLAMTIVSSDAVGAEPFPELNTILMETTFQITGPSKQVKGSSSSGTGFIVGKPSKDAVTSFFVLVTAAHVFSDIEGDFANINVREKLADGSYRATLQQIRIRENGKNVYVAHSSVDVAAVYTALPNFYGNVKQVGDALLATDDDLLKFNVHPGDELLCLGYPLGASGPYGFPILRSGKIASFPLVPAKDNKNWFFDFRVFPGNSGGPVYLIDHGRTYPDGTTHLGETLQIVIGLVTAQISADVGAGPRELQLGVVIPAVFIKETLNLLPDAPTTK
jgi:hypothetical protein